MTNLERRVDSSGIPLTENVIGLMTYEYAGVAKNLAEAKDFNGARAALDKYAETTGAYKDLHIAIEALAVSPEATLNAARLYAKEREKIMERTMGQEFISYFEQCESLKMSQLSPGERKLFNLRMSPILKRTLGDVDKEIEKAKKIREEIIKNPAAHPDNVVTNALRILSDYEKLTDVVKTLLRYHDNYLAIKSQQSSLDRTGKELKKFYLGFEEKEE